MSQIDLRCKGYRPPVSPGDVVSLSDGRSAMVLSMVEGTFNEHLRDPGDVWLRIGSDTSWYGTKVALSILDDPATE